MEMMRVLFLCSEYMQETQPLGGIFFHDQAKALNAAGVRTDVVFVEPRSLRTLFQKSAIQQRFQLTTSAEQGVFTLRRKGWNPGLPRPLAGRLWADWTRRLVDTYIARHGAPDLLHAHCALWAGYAASLVKAARGIPYVVTEHSSAILHTHSSPTEDAIRTAYAAADRIIAVSRFLGDAVGRRAVRRAIDVIPNIVDTDFFRPSNQFQGSADGGLNLLAIGNINRNKSHDILIKAFVRVLASRPNARLSIAGDGELRDELHVMTERLGVAHAVKLLGQIDRTQLRNELENADMLVHTSKHETFGVVLIEAASMGLPVVSTACGGPDDVVHPETGILVPVDDVEGIADGILRLAKNPPSRAAVRDHAASRYGRQPITSQLISLYSNVVSSSSLKDS